MRFVTFELGFPTGLAVDDVAAFVRALSARSRGRLLARTPPIIFEVHATASDVRWLISVTDAHRDLVLAQLRSHLPNVRATETDPAETVGNRLGVELRLSQQRRALRTNVAEEFAASMVGALGGLGRGESVRIQWLVGQPLPRRVAVVTPASERPEGVETLFAAPMLSAEQARSRNDKQREPVFGALGRIAVTGASKGRRRQLAQAVFGQSQLVSQPSVQLLRRSFFNAWALRRIDRVVTPRISWPCSLNAAELATLIAWPVGGPVAAGVTYSGRRELPFAENLVTSNAQVDRDRERSSGRFRVIGEATYPRRTGPVSLRADDALQHLHVIGPTGVGKSTLLANLIVQDIAAGRGVVVIEPKGDLIADVLDRIPEHRLDDVVLLDPADAEHPVGLNPLHGPDVSVETTVDALVHLFRSLFSSSWGPRTQDILHASLLTLARTPDMTLAELPLLLSDARFRARIVGGIRGDLALGPFWGWFDALSDGERAQVVAPVLNKTRAFTMRTSIRRIIGQSQPGFAMRDVFTRRRILLVPLRRGEIGPETANLLGGLVVAQLWQAVQERSRIDPARRHPVMLYLDEFQNYLPLPTELDDVLAQARGLGLGMTLAHQHLAQLSSSEMRAAVLMNARSRIVFQSGSEDAGPLAKTLGGGLEPSDLTALGRFEAYARLMDRGTSTTPGSLVTLPLAASLGSRGNAAARSRGNYSQAAEEVDAAMAARRGNEAGGKSGGRRRRTP
jgi:TraM recognition site of TraD and TraG/Type IV secretory system Conjugative DNA transfer